MCLLRLARVGWHLAAGAAIATLVLPFSGRAQRRERVRAWSLDMLRILAVRLHVTGERAQPSGVPLMIVANHVSWLDIIAINAVVPSRFVAKSEVRDWPVIGWIAIRVGTLFIRRARRQDAARIGSQLAQLMGEGDPVAVFPEGTTTDGSVVLTFHPSLMQAAVQAGAQVCPVAIRYARADGTRCADAAYCGGKTLWDTLEAIAARPGMRAELSFLPQLESRGGCRRELARGAHAAILRTLFP